MNSNKLVKRLREFGIGRLFGSALIILALGKATQLGMYAVLARRLGAEGFGQVSIAIASSNLLALVLTLGIPSSGMRFVATFEGGRDWSRMSGFLRMSGVIVLSAIILSIAGPLFFAAVVREQSLKDLAWLVAVISPIMALGMSREGIVRGFQTLAYALGPREIVAPVLVIALLSIVASTTEKAAALLYGAAFLLAEALGLILLFRNLPKPIFSIGPKWEPRQWLAVALPMQIAAAARVFLQRIDLMYVGAMLGLEWAGIYAVAHRLAQIFNLVGRVSSFAVSPLMAQSYHVNDAQALLKVSKRSTIIVIAICIPAFTLAVLFAPVLVSFFGESDYAASATIFIVLAVGQLSNAVFNPITQALLMSRHEKFQLVLVVSAAVFSAAVHPLAIRNFGAIGAAGVTAFVLVTMNIVAYMLGFRRLKSEIVNNARRSR